MFLKDLPISASFLYFTCISCKMRQACKMREGIIFSPYHNKYNIEF